ncbi:GcrA family cell cycle regulator [Bradyrhizobium sp. CCGUVB23]|uniref:GcrA family cell cycle regulator n=1 Tax=Bradyrhizobium sp. CCGUVB23 TaxID=2949630 RepID=UPI0035323AE2
MQCYNITLHLGSPMDRHTAPVARCAGENGMSVDGAGWTDERIERLKSLWAGGLSASQIAAELGGVTRNAVIGKVHRLGLSRRVTTATKPRAPRSPRLQRSSRFGPMASVRHRGNLALASPEIDYVDEQVEVTAEIVPLARYLTLAELEPSSCRWPIGDPASPEFRFCGAPALPGESYCRACARKAYQTTTPRSSISGQRFNTGRGFRP